MKSTGKAFGINLSDLLSREDTEYSHRPGWLSNSDFIEAFIITGQALGASFYVTKNYGKGAIANSLITKCLSRKNQCL